MDKKRHHYIPKSYLKFFCNEEGKVLIYRKDEPEKPFAQSPDKFGFHKYYYSQPTPDGDKDHNSLENLFSDEVEGKWPTIAECLLKRQDVNDSLEDIFKFIALQYVRVPAVRDACEARRAADVMATARVLEKAGKLPPMPKGVELDQVEVSIDPHQSILAMVETLKRVGQVFDKIGIGALHNQTDLPFLTSDNPVIWFDPSVPESEMCPYNLHPDSEIVLLFPVSPNLIIYGHSSMHEKFASFGLQHSDIKKRSAVEMMNSQICRFAYAAVYAQESGQEHLIQKHAETSPVLQTNIIPLVDGEHGFHQFVFRKRQRKPKWSG